MDASTNTPVCPMGNQNGPTHVLSPGGPDAETRQGAVVQFPVRSKLTLLQDAVAQVSRGGRAVVVSRRHRLHCDWVRILERGRSIRGLGALTLLLLGKLSCAWWRSGWELCVVLPHLHW